MADSQARKLVLELIDQDELNTQNSSQMGLNKSSFSTKTEQLPKKKKNIKQRYLLPNDSSLTINSGISGKPMSQKIVSRINTKLNVSTVS